jgi:hypothetical protein
MRALLWLGWAPLWALALVATPVAAQERHVFVDRGVERTIIELGGGELLVRTGANGSFRARLGTDRVLVITAHEGALDQLGVVIDEVLSARAHALSIPIVSKNH